MSDIYDLAAHLDEFDGTLVRRGTPVEKHCSTEWESNLTSSKKVLFSFLVCASVAFSQLLYFCIDPQSNKTKQ
jgi:hypothetical protein